MKPGVNFYIVTPYYYGKSNLDRLIFVFMNQIGKKETWCI